MDYQRKYDFYLENVGVVYELYDEYRQENPTLTSFECITGFIKENEEDGDIVNIYSYELLSRLIKKKSVADVKMLINAGVDVNCDKWHSILHDAVCDSTPEIIQLLIDNGANINNRENQMRYTPLLLACSELDEEDALYDNIKCLLENGADPNIPDLDGRYPFNACENERICALVDSADDIQYLGPKFAAKFF